VTGGLYFDHSLVIVTSDQCPVSSTQKKNLLLGQ